MTRAAASTGTSELKVVGILAFGFGLVGFDRFMISAMYPEIARDLQLGYEDIGTITGALAIAWGISAIFMGNLSDRIGRKKILIYSLIVFSLLIGASGLATGLMGLVLIRVLMGFADGAYTPPSIAATIDASPPERHGLNVGIQQMMLPLFGLGLAPILVTQLLQIVDWRFIFALVTLPGLLTAWLVYKWLSDDGARVQSRSVKSATGHRPPGSFSEFATVLKVGNIRLLSVGMLCWLTCLVTLSAFLPSYLTDYLELSQVEMGLVMSAIGWGAAAGTLLLPWLSDKLGRKPVMVLATIGAFASLFMLSRTGAAPMTLFLWLFVVNFFNFALITLTVGPIASESAPPELRTTASGTIIGVGELFGGGLAPVIVGFSAASFGIDHLLWLPMAGMVLGLAISIMLKETAPSQG